MVNDQFGVKEIYPDSTRNREYSAMPQDDSNYDPNKDNRIKIGGSGPKIKANGNGPVKSWTLSEFSQVRVNIMTSAGYSAGKIETDHSICAKRGYMMDKRDWRDVEATWYIFHKGGQGDDQYVWYSRGGTHTGDHGCEGCAMKADLFFSGKVRVAKEQWHVNYSFSDTRSSGIGDIEDRWVGMKYVTYNVPRSGKEDAVMVEIWIDNSDVKNNWKKVYEFLDTGGFGSAGASCGGKKDQILTFGGPYCTMRVDNTNGYDWKNCSVREIDPKGTFETPTEPGQGGGGGQGGGDTPDEGPPFDDSNLPPAENQSNVLTAVFTHRYHINFDDGDSCAIGGPIEEVPLVSVYNVAATDHYVSMPKIRTRAGVWSKLSGSVFRGIKPRQVKVIMKKFGSPTGTIYCRLREKNLTPSGEDEGTTSMTAEIGTFDAAILSNQDTEVFFTNLTQTKAVGVDGKILIEFEGGDVDNFVLLKVADQDPFDGPSTQLVEYDVNNHYEGAKSFDLAGEIWV